LDSGFASGTSGSMNSRLEKAFAKKVGAPYAITFNSGTTTLHAGLWALGVGFGDEVIVTPLTVIACMNAILYCNAIPGFADVDPDTFLMDPEDVRRKITPRTKAIMPVHLYGLTCNMTEIMKIAKEHDLGVLEDCAQCFMGTHNGQIAGTIGDVGSWSFENSKHLTTGDGGIVTCNNEELGDTIRKLNSLGFRNATARDGRIRVDKDIFQNPKYKRHDLFGFMYRMPEVAAAMGLAQVEKMDAFVDKREKMGNMYREVIEAEKCEWLQPQKNSHGDRNVCFSFAARYLKDDVTWENFRKKFVENGGDGIYAAWALCYNEDSVEDVKSLLRTINLEQQFNSNQGQCPVAELVQSQLMQFTANQKDDAEMRHAADVLSQTIRYFS